MTHNNNKLAILMSTYNGSKYIKEQIDSIINQEHTDWSLYIRDDGSTDGTIEIINEYACKDPRIIHYKDNLGNLGTCKSFMTLLENINSTYYAFSDQDDIWLPHKLKEGIDALTSHDTEPVLFTSDVTLVDSECNITHPSYWKFAHLNPQKRFTYIMLVVNPSIIGMTMIFNKKARDLMIPYSGINLLHDSWCSIKVSEHGRIISSDKPSVLYRQHGSNVCGIDKLKKIGLTKRVIGSLNNNWEKYFTVHKLFGISLFSYIKTKLQIQIDRKNYV